MQKFKKFFTHLLVVLLTLQGTVAALTINVTHARAASQDVVINEIMWMGSTTSASDEWIELRNTTNAPIDLSGWQLTHAATSSGTLTIPSGKTIAANGLFLISNFAQTDPLSVLNVAPDWVTTSVALSNTCSSIDLMDSLNVVFDSMGCASGSNYFAGTNTTVKAAMERNFVLASGTLSTSWHTSVGFVNLDAAAAPNNFATPKFVNDSTAPVAGAVQDDGAFTASTSQLPASWSGFSDAESGIISYQAGVGTAVGANDVVALTDMGSALSHTFTGLTLTENTTYYVNVVATNGVALTSQATSDGITVNTVNPNTPTNLSVSDVAGDGGGSVKAAWDASNSLDVTSYQLNYRRVGDSSWTSVHAGNNLEEVVNGLQNAPATYQFTVEAVDFNNQHSVPSSIVTGQALDNLPPQINGSKISLSQNAPGTTDTVQGAAGSSTEAGTANVFSVDPAANPAAVAIGTMALAADFSFLPISIGDNLNSSVWVQMADESGNKSQAVKLLDDVVAPNAPTLTKADARCPDACQVVLSWTDNGPDTLGYQVGYTATDGIEQRSLKVSSPSATLTLTGGTSYDFVVYAFDGAGNFSAQSNTFHLQLVNGVETIVMLVGGTPVTTTTALSGAREVAPVSHAAAFGATKVQAAAPTATPTSSTSTSQPTTTAGQTSGQNWAKIVIIVALLLVIAGGFYFLSRSTGDETEPPPPPAPAKAAARRATKPRTRRRRSRRKRTAS